MGAHGCHAPQAWAPEDRQHDACLRRCRRGPRVAWVGQQTERRDRTRALPPAVRNLSLRLLGTRMYHRHYHPLLELP